MKWDDAIRLGFEELYEAIRTGTGFTFDQIVAQAAVSHTNGEDFKVHHGEMLYLVPLGRLNEYFQTHEKPKPKMTDRQELAFLRKKVDEQKAALDALVGKKETPSGATVTDFIQGKASPHNIGGVFEGKTPAAKPQDRVRAVAPPPAAEKKAPKKQSLTSLQAELKEELKGKKPIDTRKAAKSGRGRAVSRSEKATAESL